MKANGNVHQLKILPKYFAAVMAGNKKFELRKDDRDYKVGDDVVLSEYDLENKRLTGARKIVEITYVLRNCPEYGLQDGFCIFGWK